MRSVTKLTLHSGKKLPRIISCAGPRPGATDFRDGTSNALVMSTKYLGETFDIHGGGMDLKFPHHECEIAQAVGATGKNRVNYWLHTNMLTVNGQKMSKSLGNSFLPSELFAGSHPLLDKGYGPMAVRFFMLQSHYSSTLDFSNEALRAAEKGYKKLSNALSAAKKLVHPGGGNADSEIATSLNALVDDLYRNMSDDFNTATTLATLFEMSARINDLKSGNVALSSRTSKMLSNASGLPISVSWKMCWALPKKKNTTRRSWTASSTYSSS